MSRYQIGSVQLHTTDLNSGNAINIGGITSLELNTGSETISDDSGAIYDESRSLLSQVPEFTITGKSIGTMLQYIGLTGYCISADGSHPGLRIFGRVLGDCQTPPASDANLRYTVAEGLIHLGELNAQRGQDATLSLMVHPITDGTNAPFAAAYTGITLPATSALAKEQFTLGMCKVGNVVLSDLQSMQINFGIELTEKTPLMGSVWPDSVAVRKVRPVITFTGFNPTILGDSAFPLLGKQATHAQTLIQLKRRLNYTHFVDDEDTGHILMTVNGIATIRNVLSGSGTGEVTQVLVVEGVHDGTNVPILIDTLDSTYDPTP